MTRIGVACAAGVLVGVAGAAEAFNPQPEPPAFGMQGAVLGQIAQLNAVLTFPPDPQLPPCVVDLSFMDASGQVFVDPAGNQVKKQVMLLLNVADSLSMLASDVLPPRQTRVQLRAVVDHPPDPQCDGLRATVEIIESRTGKTVLLYEGVPPDPQAPTCPTVLAGEKR